MLTRENYFSPENEMKYFGSTQFKSFQECESMTMARIRGDYAPEPSTALLVGQYVDSHFEGTLDLFQAQHPEMFKRDGSLKSEFLLAEDVITRMEGDDMFMKYASGGEEQVIMTAKLFGHDFKIRIDNYHPGKAIVDRKVMRDFEPVYKEGMGKVNFASRAQSIRPLSTSGSWITATGQQSRCRSSWPERQSRRTVRIWDCSGFRRSGWIPP